MQDLETLEIMHRNEMDCNEPNDFEKWVKACEKLLGHNLDGDQSLDGYSLDMAYDCWFCRMPVAEYVAKVKSHSAYKGDWRKN